MSPSFDQFYKEKKDEYEKIKKDQIKVNNELNELSNSMEPLEDRHKEIDALISKQKNSLNSKVSRVVNHNVC